MKSMEMIEINEMTDRYEAKSLLEQSKLIEKQLHEARVLGDEELIGYYTEALARVTCEIENAATSEEGVSFKGSYQAQRYREQAAEEAVKNGKDSWRYKDLLKKAELEDMKK